MSKLDPKHQVQNVDYSNQIDDEDVKQVIQSILARRARKFAAYFPGRTASHQRRADPRPRSDGVSQKKAEEVVAGGGGREDPQQQPSQPQQQQQQLDYSTEKSPTSDLASDTPSMTVNTWFKEAESTLLRISLAEMEILRAGKKKMGDAFDDLAKSLFLMSQTQTNKDSDSYHENINNNTVSSTTSNRTTPKETNQRQVGGGGKPKVDAQQQQQQEDMDGESYFDKMTSYLSVACCTQGKDSLYDPDDGEQDSQFDLEAHQFFRELSDVFIRLDGDRFYHVTTKDSYSTFDSRDTPHPRGHHNYGNETARKRIRQRSSLSCDIDSSLEKYEEYLGSIDKVLLYNIDDDDDDCDDEPDLDDSDVSEVSSLTGLDQPHNAENDSAKNLETSLNKDEDDDDDDDDLPRTEESSWLKAVRKRIRNTDPQPSTIRKGGHCLVEF